MRSMNMQKLKQVLLGMLLTFFITGYVSAQQSDFPKRWVTANEVEQQYGSPINKSEPVGNPVISFWEYGNFIVFFENDSVLHSIRK